MRQNTKLCVVQDDFASHLPPTDEESVPALAPPHDIVQDSPNIELIETESHVGRRPFSSSLGAVPLLIDLKAHRQRIHDKEGRTIRRTGTLTGERCPSSSTWPVPPLPSQDPFQVQGKAEPQIPLQNDQVISIREATGFRLPP